MSDLVRFVASLRQELADLDRRRAELGAALAEVERRHAQVTAAVGVYDEAHSKTAQADSSRPPKRKPGPLSDHVLETLVSGPKTRQELRALHCPPANENTLDSALSRLKSRGAVRKEGDLIVLVDSATLPPTSRSPSGAGAAVDQRGQQPVAGRVAQAVPEPAGSTSPSSAD